MNALKVACLTVFLWLRQAWMIPMAFVNSFKQGRTQAGERAEELERLDRLRHPSRYRGR